MATLRETIETILIEEGIHPDKIGTLTGRLATIGKSKGIDIKHQIGPNGFHRLIIDGEKSQWTSPMEIIRIGDYVAATDAYINLIPQVGKVFSLRSKNNEGKGDFVTESVQRLDD